MVDSRLICVNPIVCYEISLDGLREDDARESDPKKTLETYDIKIKERRSPKIVRHSRYPSPALSLPDQFRETPIGRDVLELIANGDTSLNPDPLYFFIGKTKDEVKEAC